MKRRGARVTGLLDTDASHAVSGGAPSRTGKQTKLDPPLPHEVFFLVLRRSTLPCVPTKCAAPGHWDRSRRKSSITSCILSNSEHKFFGVASLLLPRGVLRSGFALLLTPWLTERAWSEAWAVARRFLHARICCTHPIASQLGEHGKIISPFVEHRATTSFSAAAFPRVAVSRAR